VKDFEAGSEQSALKVVQAVDHFNEKVIDLVIGAELRILPGRREVYAAKLSPAKEAVVVKRFLAHPKQTRDWRAEWNGLLGLSHKGLPCAEPVCVAESSVDQSVWVVMKRIHGAITLGAYLRRADALGVEQIASDLAVLVDRVHAVGARQKDQHVNNWVVANGDLFLLDAGTFDLGDAPLSDFDRLMDVASICVTLLPSAERTFRKSLSQCYMSDDPVRRKALMAKLDTVILEQQSGRLRRYYTKTIRDCTEFKKVASPKLMGMYSKSAANGVVDTFFTNPERFMSEGQCLKDGNTCTVQGFENGGVSYVLKRYNLKPWFRRLLKVFSDSRARTSWSSAWLLDMAFIPTSRPVAYCEERRGLLKGKCYLLMEQLEGQLLPDFVESSLDSLDRIQAVAFSFAQVWSALGRMRAAHGDLKATNLLVDSEGVVYLFDLDAFRFGLSENAFQRGREKDYRRFMKNWESMPDVQQIFKEALTLAGRDEC